MSLPAPAPDRTALVTGASQGIGAEVAREVMWVGAPEVARVAVEAMDKGRLVAIPGVTNRVAAALAQVPPGPCCCRSSPGATRACAE